MNGLHLRLATPADAVCIGALSVQVWLDTYATEGIDTELAHEALATGDPAAIAARLGEPGRRLWVAERGARVQGYAEWALAQTPPVDGPLAGPSAELVRLYVQPQAQGRGLGARLLAAGLDWAAAQGQAQAWLRAWSGNERALAFYAAQGFAVWGHTEFVFGDQRVSNHVLGRALPGVQ